MFNSTTLEVAIGLVFSARRFGSIFCKNWFAYGVQATNREPMENKRPISS